MKQRRLRKNQNKTKRKIHKKDIVNIELDIKCSCLQSTSNDNANIQFARRYLQCQSAMSIRFIRLFIETILPYSPIMKISIFDINDQLLKDSVRLNSLKHTFSPTTFHHIPLRFTLINTTTSFANCSCLSPLLNEYDLSSSSSPTIIQQENIDKILSTCKLTPKKSSILSNQFYNFTENINLLTPQAIFNGYKPDEALINHIISEFGEICPPLSKSNEYYLPTKYVYDISSDMPLDLSIKRSLSTSFNSHSSQSKFMKT